jgi:hypothetical protein
MNKSIFAAIVVSVLTYAGIAEASPVKGTYHDTDVLVADATVTYTLRLKGDELTSFRVLGDNDGDLDCSVFDEFGNEVAKDADYTDTCSMEVKPRWTGPFKLVITNNGHEADRYVMFVR